MPRLTLLLLLALAAGCAATRPSGTLSPISARVTNEAVARDALTLDAWAGRITVQRADAGRDPAQRAYAIARAGAWLAWARDAYAWDPRDGAADAALAEVRHLVAALEDDSASLATLGVVPRLDGARPALWVALDSARRGTAPMQAPATLAGAELALARAAHLSRAATGDATLRGMRTGNERECEMRLQVALAERLLASLRPAEPARVAVVLQAEPAPRVTRASARPMQRVVHFAVNSSGLARASRATLGEVVEMLRSHPGVNLVIEGFTDARGNAAHNRELAVRRADAVRRFLDGAGLALGRVTIAGLGADSTAGASSSAAAFARDRRVTLAFTDPDGQPLTLAGYQSFDADHDRDLQIEQQKQQPRRQRGARSSARTMSSLRNAPR